MMNIPSESEGSGLVTKTRASPSATAGTARWAGSMVRAVIAGESGNERKSSIFD